ncbi:MAG TPA: DUF1992 domain-containing protein, partial [Thermomicrobiaceae bacterium]|nr:DUF1992 domain-containing protein [Thermomicrobiaceae bacterium]
MWWWDRLIEDRIQSAEERGLFDNLKSQGKPLRLDDGSGEEWLANHLLREAGALPDWLELRKEIHAARPEVVSALREYRDAAERLDRFNPGHAAILRRLEANYVKLAREINRRIDEHNMRCPSMRH